MVRRQNECHQRGKSCCAVKSSRTGFVAIQPLAGITSARTHCYLLTRFPTGPDLENHSPSPQQPPVSTLHPQPIRFMPHSPGKSPSPSKCHLLTWTLLGPSKNNYNVPTLHSQKPLLWELKALYHYPCICTGPLLDWGFPGGSDGKESTCNVWDLGSTPGLGRSPGEGKSYSLQYTGLENSMDWGRKESDTTERVSLHFTSTRLWDSKSSVSLATKSTQNSMPGPV